MSTNEDKDSIKQSRELRKKLEEIIQKSNIKSTQKKLGIKALRMHMPKTNRPK